MSKTLEINKLEDNNPETSTAPILDSLDYRDYEDSDEFCSEFCSECGFHLDKPEFDNFSKEFVTYCHSCGATYTS